jgi:hypothetical protein
MNNTCDKTSNNKYFDCPARMDDGRTFTDYRGSNYVNDMIRYSNNVMSSYDYRQFLIHNANNIMKVTNDYTQNKVGCGSCNAQQVPFNTVCDVNKSFSRCGIVDSNGIGINNVVTPLNRNEQFVSNNESYNKRLSGYTGKNMIQHAPVSNESFANHDNKSPMMMGMLKNQQHESFINNGNKSPIMMGMLKNQQHESFANNGNKSGMMKNYDNFTNNGNNKLKMAMHKMTAEQHEGFASNDNNKLKMAMHKMTAEQHEGFANPKPKMMNNMKSKESFISPFPNPHKK